MEWTVFWGDREDGAGAKAGDEWCGVSGWRRQCKGEGSPAKRGQIWRVPYLEVKRLEMTVYFIKYARNENQYKSAGFGS